MLVTDLWMPRMHGFELAVVVRHYLPGVPVLLASRVGWRQQVLPPPAAFVYAPFTAGTVREAAEQMIRSEEGTR